MYYVRTTNWHAERREQAMHKTGKEISIDRRKGREKQKEARCECPSQIASVNAWLLKKDLNAHTPYNVFTNTSTGTNHVLTVIVCHTLIANSQSFQRRETLCAIISLCLFLCTAQLLCHCTVLIDNETDFASRSFHNRVSNSHCVCSC